MFYVTLNHIQPQLTKFVSLIQWPPVFVGQFVSYLVLEVSEL